VVLARSPSDLTQADRAGLRRLLASGGTVVAAGVVARLLGGEGAGKQLIAGDATGTAAVWRMTLARGTLLAVEGASVEDVLADRSAGWAAPVWRRLAGSAPQTSAYTISLWGVTLVYSIARGGATVVLDGPEARPGRVTLYGRSGARRSDPFSPRQPGPFAISIGRRSYALALDG
jgi:hypothetical protein